MATSSGISYKIPSLNAAYISYTEKKIPQTIIKVIWNKVIKLELKASSQKRIANTNNNLPFTLIDLTTYIVSD